MVQQTLNFTQRAILAYSRTVSGTLSVVSSCLLMRKIVYRKSRGYSPTYQRMIFGMSVLDILTSSWMALSTVAVPRYTGAVGALGNTATCSAQGFFVELSVGAPIYMASLSVFFMLKIRYNMNDAVLRQKYELWLHLVPWAIALTLASTGAALNLFNALPLAELGCWVHGFPAGCGFVPGLECTRGYKIEQYIDLYAYMFSYAWLAVVFIIVVICHVLIYVGIRKQERRNAVFYNVRAPSSVFGLEFNPSDTEKEQTSGNEDRSSQSEAIADLSDIAEAAEQGNGCDAKNRELKPPDSNSSLRSSTREPRSKRSSKRASVSIFGRNERSTEKSRAAAMQSLLFVIFAFLSAVCPFLVYLRYKLGWSTLWRFTFGFMLNVINPLQGFFNLMVYVRPRYLHIRQQNRKSGRFKTLWHCIWSLDN